MFGQTNARLGQYLGYNAWNTTTKQGATIRSALDYAMDNFAAEAASELYPVVGAIAATYGDPDGKYAKFLLANAGNTYPSDASFLWNQPLSDSGLVDVSKAVNQTGQTNQAKGSDTKNAALMLAAPALGGKSWMLWYISCIAVVAFSILDIY